MKNSDFFILRRSFISRHDCPDCFSSAFCDHYVYHIWDNFSLYFVTLFLILRENFFFCYFFSLGFAILNDLIVRYFYVNSLEFYSTYYFNYFRIPEESRGYY